MLRALAIAASLALLIIVRPPQPGTPTVENVYARLCHRYTSTGTLTPEWRKVCERLTVRLTRF